MTDSGLDLKFMKNVWATTVQKCGESKKAKKLPVHPFCEAYLSHLTIRHTDQDYANLVIILSDLCNPAGNPNGEDFPHVTKQQFQLFLLYYGPPAASLAKVSDVLDAGSEWFHGMEPGNISEQLLQEQTVIRTAAGKSGAGLFLIRYSSMAGVFTMSYVDASNKVCQARILKNDLRGGVETLTREVLKFSKMSSFISKNSSPGNMFSTACPSADSYLRKIAHKQQENLQKTRELVNLLSDMGLSKYVSIMVREEINIDSFKLLDVHDIANMEIPVGPKKLMLAKIQSLKKSNEDFHADFSLNAFNPTRSEGMLRIRKKKMAGTWMQEETAPGASYKESTDKLIGGQQKTKKKKKKKQASSPASSSATEAILPAPAKPSATGTIYCNPSELGD